MINQESSKIVAYAPIKENSSGQQTIYCNYETQPYGKIVGGGTTQQPLKMVLNPLYEAAPELFALLERYVEADMGADDMEGDELHQESIRLIKLLSENYKV